MIKDWMTVLENEVEARPTPGHAVHLYKLRKITDEYVFLYELHILMLGLRLLQRKIYTSIY